MIVSAAVRFYDRKQHKEVVLPVHRHCDAFLILKEFGYSRDDFDSTLSDQGFLDEEGRFYDRVKAKQYAISCNQIEATPYPELYSEDLW